MTFQLAPINIVGQEGKSRSRSHSQQVTRNMYVAVPPSGETPSLLMPFWGLKPFGTATGNDRGMHNMAGITYRVHGTTLSSVSNNGTFTSLGTIDGTNRVSMEDDGEHLVISTGLKRYEYTVAGGVVEFADADHEPGNSSAFINSQFLYDGIGGRFWSSRVGDPGDINSLNYATAEVDSDDLRWIITKNNIAYMLGDGTIEPWENTGVGNPPFDPIKQAAMSIGLGGIYSVAETDSYIYLFGDDKSFYRIRGYDYQLISIPEITNQIEGFAVNDDCVGFTVRFDGQDFYFASFPTAKKCFVFSELTNTWSTVSTGLDNSQYLGSGFVECYGKKLVSDYRNGNIYELDPDTFTHNGEEVIYERVMAPISGVQLEKPGQQLIMSGIQFVLETGTAPTDTDAYAMVSLSFDGGQSFTGEHFINLGREGNSVLPIDYWNLRSFQSVTPRIRCSDPIYFAIHAAGIYIKQDGRR